MKTFIAAAIVATFAANAQAYYEVRADDAGAAQPDVDMTDYTVVADRRVQPLNFVGAPNAEVAALSAGYGEGVSLETALKMLLPTGWRGAIKPGVDRKAEVRWNHGVSWPEALEQIARQQNLAVTVYWQKRVTLIDPMPAEAAIKADAPATPSVPNPPTAALLPAAPVTIAAAGRPMLIPPVTASPVARAEPAPTKLYRDLNEFLAEEVRVDRTSVSLTEALQLILPPGWRVDVRSDEPSIDALRFDITHVGSRGAALNAMGRDQNLVLIPYLEFAKLVVSRGN